MGEENPELLILSQVIQQLKLGIRGMIVELRVKKYVKLTAKKRE